MRARGFSIGDRVALSQLGRARSPKMRSRVGTVVGVAGRRLHVLFDGNKSFSRMHESYLEPAGETDAPMAQCAE